MKTALSIVASALVAFLSAPVVAQSQTVPTEAGPEQPPYSAAPEPSDAQSMTYKMQEIADAADGAFGEASEAVAMVIQKVFADLGEPNAYIVGREGSGAMIVGLRYGKGVLFSKIEGERTVYWTGPSVGFDVGGDASRSFVLVYHLYDTEEIFQRFPAVEGKAYLIGGVSANYHQRGRTILVPIRLGAGWRLGANVGYIRYSREGRVLPF